jgi:polysaccharide deacetylase family protein (PEP-CTERM system associated)
MAETAGKFLFSVDLEDVRHGVVNGHLYREAVPGSALRYLSWLSNHGFKCTFFVTGMVAESYPSLIGDIAGEGHEIACHTTKHVPLDHFTPDEFRADLDKNISLLLKAGAKDITGFRAPSYSLVPHTKWVYDILAEAGLKYSTSVLSARNPLYGWPGFGEDPCLVNGKIIEMPLSLCHAGPFHFPLAGGIYFRVLPFLLISYYIKKRLKADLPVVGYFHPYDIDVEQEHFMHGGIGNNRFYNFLMYYNRKNVFRNLDKIISSGYKIIPCRDYVKELTNQDGLRNCQAYNRS